MLPMPAPTQLGNWHISYVIVFLVAACCIQQYKLEVFNYRTIIIICTTSRFLALRAWTPRSLRLCVCVRVERTIERRFLFLFLFFRVANRADFRFHKNRECLFSSYYIIYIIYLSNFFRACLVLLFWTSLRLTAPRRGLDRGSSRSSTPSKTAFRVG